MVGKSTGSRLDSDAGTQAPSPTGCINLDQALGPFCPSTSCATWRLKMTLLIGRIRNNWDTANCVEYIFLPTQCWLLFHSTLSFPSVIWDCCENRKDVPYKVSALQQASVREKWNVSEDQDTRDLLLFTLSIRLLAAPWTASCQASLSFTISQSLLKLMWIKSVMPSNHLALCGPLLLLPSIFPSHQGLFHWVSSLHQVAKALELQL